MLKGVRSYARCCTKVWFSFSVTLDSPHHSMRKETKLCWTVVLKDHTWTLLEPALSCFSIFHYCQISVCSISEVYDVLICSKVDQEIVKIIEQRARACQQREGPSYKQNCAKEMQQFNEVSRAYQSRCEYTHLYSGSSHSYSDFMVNQNDMDGY